MSSDESDFDPDVQQNGTKPSPKKKTPAGKMAVEKIYQKKSQLEHILLRPDTYIGSVEPITESMWIMNKEANIMERREITYVPGLYKIFDEILVNACDNKQRDSKMNCVKITINQETNTISVWNNGKGIPVVEHKDEKMFVPTMIFGHLLTSSNYNDEEDKVTGGRNGYGAKLCNIFSSKFIVETACSEYKKSFKQVWKDNMGKVTAPEIKSGVKEDFTKITFTPDLSKFKMTGLDKDIVDLMTRRAYDAAASSKDVKVFLNGEKLPIKNFQDYVKLYTTKPDEDGEPVKIIYENVNPRWEVAIAPSDRGFQQVSFVNSIATTKGGRHVDAVVDTIVKQIIEVVKKKNKGGMALKPFQVKNHIWIFINCLIVNPTFDSQTKENMTLQKGSFGSTCKLSEKFITQVTKSGIIESVLQWAKFKEQNQLQKTSTGKKQNKLKGVPKLEDANDAGTKNSIDCTLILTEGDSAKSLAVSGLGVVGRDKYGVFPLRGKLLNVREATHKQILENAEINNLVKILGLQYQKKYTTIDDMKTLRYGRLMIMTDQDQDGSHIKGLIINFIHHNWPTLLRLPFLEEFITPIIKATKLKEELSFYSLPEFEEWKEATPNWHTYKIKYYKGLGTSTSKEAKEYFSNMERHRILFKYSGDNDDAHIRMAFSKKLVDERKNWLTTWMEECRRRKEMGMSEDYLYTKTTKSITYTEFVNKELILFSNMDNERSIPSLCDGLKPGSRKVLFTCLKRNDKREVKVAQLAGSVAEHSAYHHGEQSLMSTIINLAQNFVGSNNINLLQPIGQFGTRLQGGKDAASPRYIFTMLSPLTRLIFHPHDDALLNNLQEDNHRIEPEWYIPIIPMVLVNGAEGIGTGWMTKIPNHNPREIIDNIKRMIRGEDPLPMKPWYKNFKGEIDYCGEAKFVVNGEIAILDDDQLEITELQVGKWTTDYKDTLDQMLHGAEKIPPLITDYKEYHTDTTVKFKITMNPDKLHKAEMEGLHKVFKLQTTMTITSMCAFDRYGVLTKFDTTNQILKEFYKVRLEYYGKRKDYLEGVLGAEALKLTNQARFIVEKCDGDLRIENRKKKEMIAELVKRKYDSDPVKGWKMRQNKENALMERQMQLAAQDGEEGGSQAQEEEDPDKDYDYLLGMTFWSLTMERKNELLKKRDDKMTELNILKKKSPADLWMDDLNELREKLDEVERKEREDENSNISKIKTKLKEKGSKKRNPLSSLDDTMPSSAGRRVQPKYEELIAKAEKAAAPKKPRAPKEPKPPKETKVKKEKDTSEDGEGKKKKGGLKQSKLSFDKVSPKKGKKKKTISDSEDDASGSDVGSDKEVSFSTSPTVAPRSTSRRAAAPKNYKIDDDDSEEEEREEIFHDNELAKPQKSGPTLIDSGSDSDFNDKEEVMKISSDEEELSKPSTPPNKKKTAAKRPAPKLMSSGVSDDSGDDSDFASSKKKTDGPAAKRPKAAGKKEKTNDEIFDELLKSGEKKSGNASDSSNEFNPFNKGKAKKAPAMTFTSVSHLLMMVI
uniref:DNA topoisomerase 2 n=1 Tax=Cacopsylla melanoneura TaxID=428564 RepID=A0A8D8TSL7_9HEMI